MRRLTKRELEAAGCSVCCSGNRLETLGILPSVGESTMHQALPVPDRAVLSASRMDRAATMSREFWKRYFVTEGAIAEENEG